MPHWFMGMRQNLQSFFSRQAALSDFAVLGEPGPRLGKNQLTGMSRLC
jgi:hypothetical protein